jgi:hypothetical protein
MKPNFVKIESKALAVQAYLKTLLKASYTQIWHSIWTYLTFYVNFNFFAYTAIATNGNYFNFRKPLSVILSQLKKLEIAKDFDNMCNQIEVSFMLET